MVTKTLIFWLATLMATCASCSAHDGSATVADVEGDAPSVTAAEGAGPPASLRLVVAQAGDELWIMVRNDGPGVAQVPALIGLQQPFRTVALSVSPLPQGATTSLATSGFVMPGRQLDAVVELPAKRMYGATYSAKKLAESMKLVPGCYVFTATYEAPRRPKLPSLDVAPSEPTEVCI